MKNSYKVLICFLSCLTMLFSVKAEDTLVAEPKLKFKISYAKLNRTIQPAMGYRKPLDIKGEGDDNGVAISFSGSFRFFGMYRVLNKSYPNVRPKDLSIGGFGDVGNGGSGSRPDGGNPLLTLFSKIVPSDGVELGIGFGLHHMMSGSTDPDSTRGRVSFGQTFGGTATFRTNVGTIKVGGGNLYGGMSQLFSGWAPVRWNAFYRLPWDVTAQYGGSWSGYEDKFVNGSTTKVDAAYVNGGRISGAILHWSDMPGGFGLNLCYGVDGQTGLLAFDMDTIGGAKKTVGGRAYKKIGRGQVGVTGILNNGYVYNYGNLRETQYMYSGDAMIVSNKFTVRGEFGATAFTSPFGKYNGTLVNGTTPYDTSYYESGVDFLGQIKLMINKEAFGFPLKISLYSLGANFVNSNAGPFNTSTYNNGASYIQINSNWDVAMRRGFIADLGQSANNRRAFEIGTQLEKGRFKVTLGTQVGTEIEKQDSSTNQVMFYHKVNPWSRAGFNFWTPRGGPYNKLLGNYIQLLERVTITDSVVDYRKTFNVFDIDARYKATFLGRPIILTNYISYQSAGDKFSPAPYFTNKAFVRVFYEELITFYQLYKSTVLVGHIAYSKAVANNRTTLSVETGKPIDQDTWGIGGGIDWNFAPMMGLYLREMWMTHRDKNFTLDRFEGFETSIELKVMF